jgi:hypothetical protein
MRHSRLLAALILTLIVVSACASSPGSGGDGTGGAPGTGGDGSGGASGGFLGTGGPATGGTGTGGTNTGGASGGASGKGGGGAASGGTSGKGGSGTGGAAGGGGHGTAGAGGGETGGTGGTTTAMGPCDIFASAGAPCVAAHSTVRALLGAYDGSLYQVRRASDGMTQDIGVLEPGGFADAAAQDAFCMGTTCTISIIYDQSGKKNHLTKAPAGGAKNTGDNEASATALKLTVGGHSVYGVHIPAGVGYRNDKTTGIATADQPETEYMITSGTYYNSGCCFDYGNAETDNTDDGAGTMEAVYFGNSTGWGKGAGSGPWVMADLENGLFAGQSTAANASNTPITTTYVTAMVKGRSGTFALRGGNAQTGGLTTFYDGARPKGYNPMKKQGAIILGIGGDNSNSAQGNFFEGVMTAGASTDAGDDNVQANIVAAGYGK